MILDFKTYEAADQLEAIIGFTKLPKSNFKEIVRPFLDHITKDKNHPARQDEKLSELLLEYQKHSQSIIGFYRYVFKNDFLNDFIDFHLKMIQNIMEEGNREKCQEVLNNLLSKKQNWKSEFKKKFPQLFLDEQDTIDMNQNHLMEFISKEMETFRHETCKVTEKLEGIDEKICKKMEEMNEKIDKKLEEINEKINNKMEMILKNQISNMEKLRANGKDYELDRAEVELENDKENKEIVNFQNPRMTLACESFDDSYQKSMDIPKDISIDDTTIQHSIKENFENETILFGSNRDKSKKSAFNMFDFGDTFEPSRMSTKAHESQ